MKLEGLKTYADLEKLYGEMDGKFMFRHKKGGWTIRRFWVTYNKESEAATKTSVFYDNNHRRYEVKINNLCKHFEIIMDKGEWMK